MEVVERHNAKRGETGRRWFGHAGLVFHRTPRDAHRPFHYWAWLHFLVNIFRAFTKARMGYDSRFVMRAPALKTGK